MPPLGYAIFAKLESGEFCPYHFTAAFPEGITRGHALAYLRPHWPKTQLAEVKKGIQDRVWADALSVRAIPFTDEQHASLLAHEHTTLPERYRSIWVAGWETPEKGLARQTFDVGD